MEAAVYPIPYEFYEKFKIKKYGFHGMSHQYVSEKAAEIVGKPYNEINTITCHLGNGSSITAVNKGVAVENSMGFTPLAGVTMGTRSGSIDPAIILYLIENKGYTSKEVGEILNKKSGLLGVSGISSDLRDLWSEAEKGNERAKLALDIFAYRVKKCIGEYAAVLGGIDVLVFTAGIGENDVATRAKIIEGLEFMGVEIDNEKNKKGKKVVDISKDGSKVKTLVIQTNEEIVIARETLKRINGQ
jgi:acetate kinase